MERVEKQTKKAMLDGQRFDDESIDYCFWHRGVDGLKYTEKLSNFFKSLEGYAGQLVLENTEGSSWDSSCIGSGGRMSSGRVGRKIVYGRLRHDKPYVINMPNRNLTALTSSLKLFRFDNGWEDIEPNMQLNDFVDVFLSSSNLGIGTEHIYKIKRITASLNDTELSADMHKKELQGIYMNIYSPMHEKIYGGSVFYNSEPHRSLIIGDEAAAHYLSKQNLEVRTRQISIVEIPKI